MTRTVDLIESQGRDVEIDADEADVIIRLGSALASKKQWWGTLDEAGDEPAEPRSIISCQPTRDELWRICATNTIGAFGTDRTTFIVHPKIPMSHAVHILSRSSLFPRLDATRVSLDEASNFFELIALWFVERTKEVIARDLLRDYEEQYGALGAVRGQIDALPSASQYYTGSLDIVCRFDDFTINNAYNRVLLAAAVSLQKALSSTDSIRRESRRVSNYFNDVGELQVDDVEVQPDRRSYYYADALLLAKLIIRSMGIELLGGSSKVWTFLIRTPEAIEDGLRSILRNGLRPVHDVSKYGTTLAPSTLLIEPDLRFSPTGAVGDCKYKIYEAGWVRSDLYQSVAFAAGVRTTKACVVSFSTSAGSDLQDAHFGDITVRNIRWNAFSDIAPQEAETRLITDCRNWLTLQR